MHFLGWNCSLQVICVGNCFFSLFSDESGSTGLPRSHDTFSRKYERSWKCDTGRYEHVYCRLVLNWLLRWSRHCSCLKLTGGGNPMQLLFFCILLLFRPNETWSKHGRGTRGTYWPVYRNKYLIWYDYLHWLFSMRLKMTKNVDSNWKRSEQRKKWSQQSL